MKDRFDSGLSSEVLYSSPNGAQALSTIHEGAILHAKRLLLFIAHYELDSSTVLSTRNRNAVIRSRYSAGEHISKLAKEFGISPQRVHQIVNFKNK